MQQDQYLPCAAYEKQTIHPEFSDFAAFQDAESKEFYFAMLDAKGKVVLKSEGYPLEKSRETGLKSVIKNRVNRNFFSVKGEKGAFFVSLRAGNWKEIARSCDFKTEKAAESFIEDLFTVKAEKTVTKKATAKKAAKPAAKKTVAKTAAKATTEKVVAEKAPKAPKATAKTATKTTKKVAAKVEKVTTKKVAKPAAEKATKTTTKVEGVKTTAAIDVQAFEVKKTYVEGSVVRPAVVAATSINRYLNLDAYYGHPTLTDEYGPTGYAAFQADNAYFFVVYNPDRSIFLRSEAFSTEAERNEKLEAVQMNIVNADQYQVRELGEAFAVVLLDANQTEIARSGEFTSFTEAFRSTPKGRVRNEGVVLY